MFNRNFPQAVGRRRAAQEANQVHLAVRLELAGQAAIALENTQQWEHLVSAQRQIADQAAQRVQLIGECPPISALRSTIGRVADFIRRVEGGWSAPD